MKKIFIALCASFALASCTTITKTATSIREFEIIF